MRRWVLACMAMAVALALIAGCGGGSETASPEGSGAPGGPVGQSEASACAANRKLISTAAQQYYAMEGMHPKSIRQLVPKYLQSLPTCPAGGFYNLDGTVITCSEHGS